MTINGIVFTTGPYYVFSVDVIIESLILRSKFQTIDQFVENVCVLSVTKMAVSKNERMMESKNTRS